MKTACGLAIGIFLIGLCAAANNRCFVLGVEQNIYPGFTSITLQQLTSSYAAAFIAQYNSYGIDFIFNNISATNCLMTIGELQCIYPPTDTNNFVLPFTTSGNRDCVWTHPVGPVRLGTWNSLTFYPVLNTTILNNWRAVTCPSTNYHYTLLVANSCNTVPTSPPAKQVTCCYYYSHTQSYEGYFCQQYGTGCPTMDDYIYVGNTTQLACSDCSMEGASMFTKDLTHKTE